MSKRDPIDHLGWHLHQAFAAWKDRFNVAMAARGCPWMVEARGALVQYIGADGVAQNVLVRKSGLTKQAVQQHLDDLVADDVVARVADRDDARRKRVVLTDKGQAAARVADTVKREIEAEVRSQIGAAAFEVLVKSLTSMAQTGDAIDPGAAER
ncbi:winged helix-turn-helix transcriptional regulator [Sulfitobacter sp. TSTF-M16]|uniref:Winged helix-turn-helix transcriptional regulator n=1 Tax=Sulfitobacter aestuariivivens TaxID=2766981 RepID=A0A927D3C5_9RHOB|nr:MarR family winged helix-turn-helix transcriptional regulator [Sulfitobacter aestuariivivens]MBD3664265.1 winged helix-turn-helix transcriptional regulator [Sulfitobacter aestuariivivens]